MKASRSSSVDYQTRAEFRYQIRRFLNFSEREARAAGLEPQQHEAMLAIRGLPEGVRPTIGELAERLQIQHHSAVELADRLEKHGLIRRYRGEQDHREVLLRLAPSGERVLSELSHSHARHLRDEGTATSAHTSESDQWRRIHRGRDGARLWERRASAAGLNEGSAAQRVRRGVFV